MIGDPIELDKRRKWIGPFLKGALLILMSRDPCTKGRDLLKLLFKGLLIMLSKKWLFPIDLLPKICLIEI